MITSIKEFKLINEGYYYDPQMDLNFTGEELIEIQYALRRTLEEMKKDTNTQFYENKIEYFKQIISKIDQHYKTHK